MMQMLLFQGFRTENIALGSEFHVLGLRSSGFEISSELTPEHVLVFCGLWHAPVQKLFKKC